MRGETNKQHDSLNQMRSSFKWKLSDISKLKIVQKFPQIKYLPEYIRII